MHCITAVDSSGVLEKLTASKSKDQPAVANLEAIPAAINLVMAESQQFSGASVPKHTSSDALEPVSGSCFGQG